MCDGEERVAGGSSVAAVITDRIWMTAKKTKFASRFSSSGACRGGGFIFMDFAR
jgi:hypothetical protein